MWNLLIRLSISRLNSLFLCLAFSLSLSFLIHSHSFSLSFAQTLVHLYFCCFFSGEEPGYRYHRCISIQTIEPVKTYRWLQSAVYYIFFILYYFLWQTNVSNYYNYVWILSLAYPYHKTELISPYHSLLGIIVKLSIFFQDPPQQNKPQLWVSLTIILT